MLARTFDISFLVVYLLLFLMRCFKGVLLFLPEILCTMFQTVLDFVLEFILDTKFLHEVRLDSLIERRAFALQTLNLFKFSGVG